MTPFGAALRFPYDSQQRYHCLRRSKTEPPCRVNREPGVEADAVKNLQFSRLSV